METHSSVQSFGAVVRSTEFSGGAGHVGHTMSQQTADFEGDDKLGKIGLLEHISDGSGTAKAGGGANPSPLVAAPPTKKSYLKQQFLVGTTQPSFDWRSTTPKSIIKKPDSADAPSHPEQKKQAQPFSFQQLEELQNNKFEQLAQLKLQ